MSWCGGGEISRRPAWNAGSAIPRVHLVPGQLAALAGLGALRHLDLDVVGVDQVLAGHAEPAGRHLLDGAAALLAVRSGMKRSRIFAAFAGVDLPPIGSWRWRASRAPRR
jgi:hypothetical protein